MAPPMKETVTIINKSGKVVSTGKQLVNIFKDAKAAYQAKKAQLREEHCFQEEARLHRAQRRLHEARYDMEDVRAAGGGGDDAQSMASSSRRSHRSHKSHRSSSRRSHSHASRQEAGSGSRPPPLALEEFPDAQSMASGRSHRSHRSHTRTRQEFNFDDVEEEDVQSLASKRGHRSHQSRRSRSVHGSRAPTQYAPTETHGEDPEEGFYDDPPLAMYRQPFAETEMTLARRFPEPEAPPRPGHVVRRETAPATYAGGHRVLPDISDDDIDMNLAYGDLPPPLESDHEPEYVHEPIPQQLPAELDETMSKLDSLLIEAQCLHHTATTIMTDLQANPEAMAAVALTLAELSSLLTKMSPSILPMLKASSPAIFALLASPQFLIAGGVALGVTVVMFNGYKIIKKLQAAPETNMEAPMAMQSLPPTPGYPATPGFMDPKDMQHPDAQAYEEAIPYDAYVEELSSIDIWRRGIVDAELESVGTSVDGEYITPTAARHKEGRHAERIRQRAAEERVDEEREEPRGIMSRLTGKSRRSKTLPIRSSSSSSSSPHASSSTKDKEEEDDDDNVDSSRTSRKNKASKSSKSHSHSHGHKSSRSSKKDDDTASLASERTERSEREKDKEVKEKEKKKKTPLSIFRSKTEKGSSYKDKGKGKEGKKMGHHPLLLEL
ncbi:hypothetical protein DSL72_007314 [Monilinia vaccinii-corymbosi]|uniref:Uncharacterized protein n=1 Tax=Monilinia vaccinii-corymbosi TaxID=61207 RepID=A0A8A3PMN7_9HELO|nr:hypothetical protein DSL72_007314 [Monilinia vaccinii-corymbosi]